MKNFSIEAKVGVFVLVGLAMLAYMTLRLGQFDLGEAEGYRVWALFDQAGGLKVGAPVEMAGIGIGTVEKIGLDNGRARLTMRIREGVPLAADAQAVIRTRGVLGDKFVAIEQGSEAAPRLTDGERVTQTAVPADLDQVMSSIGRVADDIRAVTESLKVSIASPESQGNIKETLANVREITSALKNVLTDNVERIQTTMANLERFAGDLSQISSQNKQAVTQTINNFQTASQQMQRSISSLSEVLDKINRGQGTLGALVNERQTVEDLNATLASLKEVTQKINQGKGSLGKLVNDDTTVDRLDRALAGINDYISRGDEWKVFVDYRGEYMFDPGALRSTLNLRLMPKADKFYLVGLVSDPIGKRTELETFTETTEAGVTTTKRVKQTRWDRDEILWNAQIGKRFHDLTLRGGLFASFGGFGADYHLFDDRLKLTFEAYDFRIDENPHLKLAADLSFWRYFYLTTGVDNIISTYDDTTFFLGGGVYFSDDDLRFLLTKAPLN